MSTKKEVAVSGFSNEVPAYINKNSDRGSEDVGSEDVTIPRLQIIQDLSPQHKKNKEEYIAGAEPGMIFNTVTNELFEQSIFIVPCYYRKEWLIWKDQNKGGGFRGAFPDELSAKRALAGLEDAADCEVVDTAQHYVLLVKLLEDGKYEFSEAVVSMSKSQMKVNRKLNAALRMAGGDRFAHVIKLTAVQDQNAAGQEYYNWSFSKAGYAPEEVYKAGESLYEAVKAGERNVAHEETVVADDSTDGDDFI